MNHEAFVELFKGKAKPSIAFFRTPLWSDEGAPGSWFGGTPTLPQHIEWPTLNPEDLVGLNVEIPMHFFAQINLEHLPMFPGMPDMPRTGTLFIFLELAVGFSFVLEDLMNSGQCARIIHVHDPVAELPRRSPPPMPDLSGFPGDYISTHYHGTSELPEWPLMFEIIETLPSFTSDPRIGGFDPDLVGDCGSQIDDFELRVRKNLNDMVNDRRFTAKSVEPQRLFGATKRQTWPKFEEPGDDPSDMLLFMALGEDPGLEFGFYDGHSAGIWISRRELAAGRFGGIRVWDESY